MYQKVISDALRTVSEEEAPHLHAVVAGLCEKAGTPKPEICFIRSEGLAELVKQKKLSALDEYFHNRMAFARHKDGKPQLVIGERFRTIMGHYSPGAEVGEDFKAALAHEIGHLKRGDTKLNKKLIEYSPLLGLLAGTGGVWLYDQLKGKSEALRTTGAPEDTIRESTQRDLQESGKPNTGVAALEETKKAAKYVTGALLGLGAGIGAAILGQRHMEFGADKISAGLMDSGKPLANALRRLETALKEEIKGFPEVMKQASDQKWLEKLSASFNVRIDRLSNWAKG